MNEQCWVETPLGMMYLAIRDGALREAGFVETWARPVVSPDDADEREDLSAAAAQVRDAVSAYFAGDVEALDRIEINPDGTDFQRAVWQAIREVPAGQTASYQEIASAVGQTGGLSSRRYGDRAQSGRDRRTLPPDCPLRRRSRRLRRRTAPQGVVP